MIPGYVKHDDHVWIVTGNDTIDGEPFYLLRRNVPGRKPVELIARVSDCQPVTPERKRRFRDSHGVIEFDSRGNITLREPRRRKRYVTTIAGLLAMAARQEAAQKARDRAFNKRRRG